MDYRECIYEVVAIIFGRDITVPMDLSRGQSYAFAQARQLVAWAIGGTLNDVLIGELIKTSIDQVCYVKLIDAAHRRAAGEPLQYIVGNIEFMGRNFVIGPGVFIPRPETELLALWMLEHIRSDTHVLDICTGSGVLAITAALAGAAQVGAIDCDLTALHFAQRNAQILEADIQWYYGDAINILTACESVDIVICNPPYVPLSAVVDPEVSYDPQHAVYAGPLGRDLLELLIPRLGKVLRSGGLVGIEHDVTHDGFMQKILAQHGFNGIEVHYDLTDLPRFTTARLA